MVVLPVAEWMSLDLDGAEISFDYKMLKHTNCVTPVTCNSYIVFLYPI